MDCEKERQNKIEVFRMWVWRRMKRTKWVNRVSNEDILTRVKG